MSVLPDHKNFAPFDIGARFRILPPGHCDPDGKTGIIMTRGAFGSGEHETTVSCLEILETIDLSGARILDVGSGTGILAIAAIKLGAGSAVCLDIDPDAVRNASINCLGNGVDHSVRHHCGDLKSLDETGFDLVLANIYGDILMEVCDDLVRRVNPGGTILLSGILWEDNFAVRNRYEKNGCRVCANRLLGEFSTVRLHRP